MPSPPEPDNSDSPAPPGLYDPALDFDSCGVGFIASIRRESSHRILRLALQSLANVAHRGGVAADATQADGSGLLCDLAPEIVGRWLDELGISAPASSVAVAMGFLPRNDERAARCIATLRYEIERLGFTLLGKRTVPVEWNVLSEAAQQTAPIPTQFFVAIPPNTSAEERERQLYQASRRLLGWSRTHEIREFSLASLSARVIIYKGLISAARLGDFYRDLADPAFVCRFAVYHQRFSTNTTPQWDLCQPFPMLAHNGEINTVRGNRNWMNARQPTFSHANWPAGLADMFPITSHDESDSASLNNALQLLRHSGRDVLHAMSILVPPAWRNSISLSQEEKDFFDYHSCFSEPWDGPAAIVFTDGDYLAACTDRNGLRPARYKITQDGLLILGSETGAERIPQDETVAAGRLSPGQMLALCLKTGTILADGDIKARLASRQPYGQWLSEYRTTIPAATTFEYSEQGVLNPKDLTRRQIAAGLTQEDRDILIGAMVESGKEATLSMGLDTPLAILSRRPQSLCRYFKQGFAQVTNPPIDSIREKNVMSVAVGVGPERNLLTETPEHCRIVVLDHPLLFEGEREHILDLTDYRPTTIPCVYSRYANIDLRQALSAVCQAAAVAAQQGSQVICLSDEEMDAEHVAIPMLMAVGAVHHYLSAAGLRMRCSLLVNTAAAWDPHDFALLFGFGATTVCPYLALRTAVALGKTLPETAHVNYRQAIEDGLRKIMAKTGISVLNSYQGAQIFEVIGLDQEVMGRCFRGTRSSIGGAGFDVLQRDAELLHAAAFEHEAPELANEGRYKPKKNGVRHLINGRVTKSIHEFVRHGDTADYSSFAQQVQPGDPYALRDLLEFRPAISAAQSLETVEPEAGICRRFTTAAMSLGAISPEAHRAIAVAMNRLGGKSNSGEGGEEPARQYPANGQPDSRSRIKQVASGRFGVTTEYLQSADEIEIKMAQGAKPGEGGQLGGFKVNEMIARLRHTDPGVTLISPPPHHDIYSIEDLAQLIYDLKCVNPRATVCVKLVARAGVGNIAVGVAKANADVILISGHEGGTGASPLSSINHAGIPWEIGLAETHQALLANGLRERVVLRADGGIKTGRDVLIAAMLGAEEFSFGTMALIALGCVYVKKCHLNNCPVGIATQDEEFRKRFQGEPEHLERYLGAVANDVRVLLAGLGFSRLDEVVGQTKLLQQRRYENHDKANSVSLKRLLAKVKDWQHPGTSEKHPHPITCFDDLLTEQVLAALDHGEPVAISRNVTNTDRNIGSRLSGLLCGRVSDNGDDIRPPVELNLSGSAGQSLGAFLHRGISIELVGEANDYVGKSLSGGKLVVRPPAQLLERSGEHVILGNTCLYGATGGTLFAAGIAAERFAIRNSGAIAVVEGCGAHGCEYMTRGTVVILGACGSNLGAGMTGGTVYVFDPRNALPRSINRASVEIDVLTADDADHLQHLVRQHAHETGSILAAGLLENWASAVGQFRKVQPISEKRPPVTVLPAETPQAPVATPVTL